MGSLLRLWDTYFSEGLDLHIYVCLGAPSLLYPAGPPDPFPQQSLLIAAKVSSFRGLLQIAD